MLSRKQFDDLLKRQGTLLLDGPLATELESRGYDLDHPLWSAKILDEDPMIIKQVHLDYFLAGANVAITASYQASVQGFAAHLSIGEDKAAALIKRSATLARLAVEEAYGQGVTRDTTLIVAGSVGPYGAYLADGSEYRGDYRLSKSESQSFHRPRIQALIEADVDLLAIETMPQYEEVQSVLELLRDEFPNACAWLSCTLRDTEHISDGTPLKDLVNLVKAHQSSIVALGFNCVSAEVATDALRHLATVIGIPLVVYPNSGETWNAETNTWSNTIPDKPGLDECSNDWHKAGARLIGGCCRTTPADIRKLSKAFRK